MTRLIENHWTKILAAFLLVMTASFMVAAHSLWQRPDDWLIGDWLINYRGGFVRRGLPGDFFLGISALTGVSMETAITLVLTILCAVIFGIIFVLGRGMPPGANSVLIIFSPAFVQFIALGPDGFRKEILLYALLSLHSYRMACITAPPGRRYLAFLSLGFIVLVLSNEMMLAFLPYFICGFYLRDRQLDARRLLKYLALVAPAGLIACTAMLFFRGNDLVISGICNSLQEAAPYACAAGKPFLIDHFTASAIGCLAMNFGDAVKLVIGGNPPKSMVLNGIMLVLALAPVAYAFKRQQILKLNPHLAIFPAMSLLATIPLLFVFADYGRLICIHTICLSLVLLQALYRREPRPASAAPTPVWVWMLCLVYIAGWRVIGYQPYPSGVFPALKAFKEITQELKSHPQ